MPKFEVIRDTIDSATGRMHPAGSTWEFTPQEVVVRDLRGDPVLDDKGEFKTVPMKIGSNLREIKDEPEAKKAKA